MSTFVQNIRHNIILFVLILVGLFLFAFISYGSYRLYRYVNWSLAYEDQSVELIRSMVKESCLK